MAREASSVDWKPKSILPKPSLSFARRPMFPLTYFFTEPWRSRRKSAAGTSGTRSMGRW